MRSRTVVSSPRGNSSSGFILHHSSFIISRRAFTLIEILVSIAIIVLLATILFAVGISVRRSSLESSNKVTLKNLDLLLADFLKNNREPPISPSASTSWVSALLADPESAKGLQQMKGFTRDPVTKVVTIVDVYGTPIQYVHSIAPPGPGLPSPQPNGRFKSYGADAKPDTQDDVFSDGVAP